MNDAERKEQGHAPVTKPTASGAQVLGGVAASTISTLVAAVVLPFWFSLLWRLATMAWGFWW